jgi:hypothetical protein
VFAETTGVASEITGVAAQTRTPGVTTETTEVVANEEEEEEEDEEEPYVELYNPNAWTPSVQRVHGLCPRKGREYIHLHATVMHYAMAQCSLKKRI